MAAAHTRIRWDRLGRWALLFVLALVALPLHRPDAHLGLDLAGGEAASASEVATLRAENEKLRAHEASLQRQLRARARGARGSAWCKAGERAYIVEGLPKAHGLASLDAVPFDTASDQWAAGLRRLDDRPARPARACSSA